MVKIKIAFFERNLEELFPETREFALKSVAPVYVYESGTRTDVVSAFRYTVVDTVNFEIFEIKVRGARPIVSKEDIENATEHIFVKFQGAVVRPFRIEFGQALCSITADSVEIVE